MKCLICGSDISSSGDRCKNCGASKGITTNKLLFAWTARDKATIKEKRKAYQDEALRIHNEEQRRIQEENRKLEEQRKIDQKIADERKAAEAKRIIEEKQKAEHLRLEQERVRKENEKASKQEIESVENNDASKKSKRNRNIIIGVIVFLMIAGIASSIEEQTNHTPEKQQPTETVNTNLTTGTTNESIVEYINNDWNNERVVLNNWEVPFKAYDNYVENCSRFTLEFSISNVIDGNPYGVWIVYLRNKNGVWNEITTFAHTKSHGEEASSIEIKANSIFEPFDAIALARKANDSSNHSFWYDTKNFVIND